jgi:hypothetical protein
VFREYPVRLHRLRRALLIANADLLLGGCPARRESLACSTSIYGCLYTRHVRRALSCLNYTSVHICWSGLSAGAIVGIVITVLVALAVLGFAGTKLADNRKKIARSVPVHA